MERSDNIFGSLIEKKIFLKREGVFFLSLVFFFPCKKSAFSPQTQGRSFSSCARGHTTQHARAPATGAKRKKTAPVKRLEYY